MASKQVPSQIEMQSIAPVPGTLAGVWGRQAKSAGLAKPTRKLFLAGLEI